jgi:YD repeat-containing protein
MGNRTSSHQSAGYSYQPFNKLTGAKSGQTYSYDSNGNLTAKIDTNVFAELLTQYQWDAENRLVTITQPELERTFAF